MFIALYITACLPCDFVLKYFTLSIPFSEHDVSYLCVFSIETLSGSLIMLDSENKELV